MTAIEKLQQEVKRELGFDMQLAEVQQSVKCVKDVLDDFPKFAIKKLGTDKFSLKQAICAYGFGDEERLTVEGMMLFAVLGASRANSGKRAVTWSLADRVLGAVAYVRAIQ